MHSTGKQCSFLGFYKFLGIKEYNRIIFVGDQNRWKLTNSWIYATYENYILTVSFFPLSPHMLHSAIWKVTSSLNAPLPTLCRLCPPAALCWCLSSAATRHPLATGALGHQCPSATVPTSSPATLATQRPTLDSGDPTGQALDAGRWPHWRIHLKKKKGNFEMKFNLNEVQVVLLLAVVEFEWR
jgi:hypothetical protein